MTTINILYLFQSHGRSGIGCGEHVRRPERLGASVLLSHQEMSIVLNCAGTKHLCELIELNGKVHTQHHGHEGGDLILILRRTHHISHI